jgi:antitoxin (DNA-binding transcriptional repressor) of toxin-antitoxin stability system
LRLEMKIEAMLWIVVLILVALAFLFPKTRAFSLSAIGVAIVAIVVIVVIAKRGEPVALVAAAPPSVEQKPVDFERFHLENLDKADPEARNRIRVEEIRFDQVRAEAGAERGSIGRIVARLYNDSATYTLTDYGYYLVVQDCIRAVCTTVFDQHGLSAASVPPNQARDVEIAIRDGRPRDLPPIKILGTANILLTPDATRAQLAGGRKPND